VELLAGREFTVASYGPAAAYTAWLLKSFGADVKHVSALDPQRDGLFFAEGAAFAEEPRLATPSGVPLITDAPVNARSRAALEQLSRESPVAWITPWGLDSEWDERPATGLLLQAAGGWMSAVGKPGREPLGPPGEQAALISGLWTAIHALAAGGEPGMSVVSMAEAVAATCIYDPVAFQYLGVVRQRWGHRFNRAQCTLVTVAAKDGYLGIHAALHHQWLELCRLMGRPEMLTDERFAALPERMQHLDELDAILEEWATSRPRWQAYHELQAAAIPSAGMPSLKEVLDSPQLAARDSWREVIDGDGRCLKVPGPPARVTTAPLRADIDVTRPSEPWKDGALRVVDMSMGWAGPMVSYILANYGADVVKLESHRRFDWWRGSRPPGDDPTMALHERSHVFNSVNRGKRGLTLDLTTPRGIALARELLLTADVVVENFRAGAMEKLGLGYEALAAENPGLIMLRQPGFGLTGPESQYRVFGNTIEAMSGLSSMIGYEDEGRPYMLSNALGDPVSGLNGAVAVLAALAGRERTGRGCCIEASQLEGFLPLVAAELIETQRSGVAPRPHGNTRPGAGPSGLFRAAGEDDWVAVEVRNDAERDALGALVGEAGADDWIGARSRDEAVAALVAAGVPAAPLHTEADLLQWDPLTAAGFFEGFERAHVGFHLYPSLPVIGPNGRPQPGSAAPTLGEHNAEILAGLGVDGDGVEELRLADVIGEYPA
jgi:crotonobetainyl-CoA:carnitine CoA-transferase CaiB-like acyl-CoA transferase